VTAGALVDLALLLSTVAAVAAAVLGLRARRRLVRRMDRMAEQLRDLLAARQDLAAMEARSGLIVAGVSMARELVERGEVELARLPLAEAEALALQAQRELTAMMRQLRPAALESRTLGAVLEEWVAAWSRQSAIDAEVSIALESPLPREVEEALFRIVQEALSNVARHSGAARTQVRLIETDGIVMLEVADDGGGIDGADPGDGAGLAAMRERIEALGGELRVSAGPDGGTTVRVTR
jgi:NarL family two-component system sensor histidine kinase LiaS